jgi:octaprenyl-diphosphate synthase
VINEIRASVEAEFAKVNALIVDQLHSDVDMVENVGQYIVDAGGKRLRPLLALLAAASVGEVTEKHIKFAAIIEFIQARAPHGEQRVWQRAQRARW